ncbi:hypothetical protein [Cognataquiflexum rubidum]|uniref:hypothetical protein n=1 Tax=Cognataquiflexum rubidum TaxID=2922273 RepID=UPI001F136790|nr:hypothetical protein [Cognataquiflexum rubidum]MCH6233779.1 hypothetical protein [Cognataquiflexum rubidum]
MKNRLIFLISFLMLLVLAPTISQAQFEVGFGYLNSTPRGPMSNYINRAGHGVSTDVAYRIPRTNLSIGVQFAASGYGYEKREERYRFNNGYEGNVNVEIYNIFSNNSAYLKYDILNNVFVQPYLFFGGGFSYISTDLSIIDPREEFTSDCPKPLESSTLVSDRTSYLLLGGGFRFDLSYPFKSLERRKLLFDIRLNHLNGGEVRYMSLDEPTISNTTVRGENVSFDFASAAQPDIIHEYHAGSSYRTRMQFITVNAGLFYVFGNKKGNRSRILDTW